jgi:hypothetical protein
MSKLDHIKQTRATDWAKRLSGVGIGMLAGGLTFADGDNQQAFVTLGAIQLALGVILYGWTRFRRRSESPPATL